jgi:hypothetical protein
MRKADAVPHPLPIQLACLVIAASAPLAAARQEPAQDEPQDEAPPLSSSEDDLSEQEAQDNELLDRLEADVAAPDDPFIVRPSNASALSDDLLPGLDLPDPRPIAEPPPAEGETIIDAQCVLAPINAGAWALVFDPPAGQDAAPLPPMVLQPNRRAAEMIRLVAARPETVTFRVSGEVFVYRGRRYLLPQRFTVLATDGPSAEEDPETLSDAAEAQINQQTSAAESTDGPADDATSDAIARRLLNAAGDNTELAARREALSAIVRPDDAEASLQPSARPDRLVNEGTLITARTGRLERSAAGLWRFVSDNDVDAEANPETAAPMILLPCATLEAIENDFARRAADARISLSGRVLVFEGENYLLPIMYRLLPETEGNLIPAQ